MKIYGVFIFLSLFISNAYCDDLDVAISNVRQNCTGISDKLSDLKKMAGINTAVTGVGTVAATGATVVGIVKSSMDKQLQDILSSIPNTDVKNPNASVVMNVFDSVSGNYDAINVADLKNKSKTLGNWRTGLTGGAAATNIAGAIIAAKNQTNEDLETQIDNCKNSIKKLRDTLPQARANGVDTTYANKIIDACNDYNYLDISPINKRATGAMISSIVGATTGVTGAVTSAVANTDNNENIQINKNLNTAANVLSGGTAIASATATIFNATQISAIKKLATIADKCQEVLK